MYRGFSLEPFFPTTLVLCINLKAENKATTPQQVAKEDMLLTKKFNILSNNLIHYSFRICLSMHETTTIWVGQRKATTKHKNNRPFSFRKLCQKHHRKMKESPHNLQNWKLMRAASLGVGFFWFLGGEEELFCFFKLAVLHSSYSISVWAPGSLHVFFVVERAGKL